MARSYNVYGIGNALVDIQYRVLPAFLEQMQVEKGVMTLIDEARQQDLMAHLWDIPAERSSGGSAANTMIGVANLGGRAYYACKVGLDADGDFYLKDLEAAGVGRNPSNRGEGLTGKCLVLITPDADRTMNTFLGITSTFGPEQIDEAIIRQSDYLYIEGYLLSSDTGFEAALAAQRCAQACETRVALTLSDPFIVSGFGTRVRQIVDDGVDLLFCNEAEVQAYTGIERTADACAALSRDVAQFAVTCGPDGALIGDGGATLRTPGFKVDAVDTNGAGDMFAGAFLFGMTNGYDIAQSAKLATYASSRIVAQYGPRLNVSLKGAVARILDLTL